jgi:hypothetical protein
MDQNLETIKKILTEELSKEKYSHLSNSEKQNLGNDIFKNTFQLIENAINKNLDPESYKMFEELLLQNASDEAVQGFLSQRIPNFQNLIVSEIKSYIESLKI